MLDWLSGRRAGQPHIVIAATHDLELVELLRERYEPFHFEDSLGAGGLTFTYRLTAGPATTRNAIALLELNGAPPRLIQRALARAAQLDRQRGIGNANAIHAIT
jgi:DNA mismatch repair ATPase MutS